MSSAGGRQCTQCGAVRPIDDFPFKSAATATRHSRCRECTREASRLHYAANRSAYRERNRRNNPRQRFAAEQRVIELLRNSGCAVCGETDVVVLEFHHRRPAERVANISDMITNRSSVARIETEIAKCDMLCANCHQRLTALGRKVHYKLAQPENPESLHKGWRAMPVLRNGRIVLEQLEACGCVDYGINDPLVLQFDHRERKTTTVSWIVSAGWSARRLAEEMSKCDIRCANCHRRRTAQLAGWSRLSSGQVWQRDLGPAPGHEGTGGKRSAP